MRKRNLIGFFVLAFGLPILLVAVGSFFPGLFGLKNIGDLPLLYEATIKELGINVRTTGLLQNIQLCLEEPVLWFIVVYSATPTLAALIMLLISFKKSGFKEYACRFLPWQYIGWKEGIKWWGIMIVTLAAIKVSTGCIRLGLGYTVVWFWGDGLFSINFLWFYFLTLFFNRGALLEEPGWRGFALPHLQKSIMNPLWASVLLGVLWALWHLAADIVRVAGNLNATYIITFVLFISEIVIYSIIISFFFNKTGFSTLIAIAIHGLKNDDSGISGVILGSISGDYMQANTDITAKVLQLLPALMAAVILILIAGKRLGLLQNSGEKITQ